MHSKSAVIKSDARRFIRIGISTGLFKNRKEAREYLNEHLALTSRKK